MKIITLLLLLLLGWGKAQSQMSYQWGKTINPLAFFNSINAIKVASSGNVYVTGYFQGTTDFDPSPTSAAYLSPIGAQDCFIAKFNGQGDFIWVKNIGGAASTAVGTDICLDQNENILIAGHYTDYDVDFDPGTGVSNLPPVSSSHGFYGEYDSNGNLIWIRQSFPTTLSNTINSLSITTDASNNVYVVGGGVGLGCFILKSSSSGSLLFLKNLNSSDALCTDIAVSNSGEIVVVGYFAGSIDMDPSTNIDLLTGGWNNMAFIGKYDSNCNYLWGDKLVGSNIWGESLTLDVQGNIYFAGREMYAGGAFLSKWTPLGALQWFYTNIGAASYVQISIDNNGKLILAGFGSVGDFDPLGGTYLIQPTFPFGGYGDIFVCSYNTADCSINWGKAIGGGAESYLDIEIDQSNNLFVSLVFSGDCDMDPSANVALFPNSSGFYDFIIAKYSGLNVGIDDKNILAGEISVFPNPAVDKINVSSPNTIKQGAQIIIYDLVGNVILKQAYQNEIFVEALSSGTYFIEVISDDCIMGRSRFVKK